MRGWKMTDSSITCSVKIVYGENAVNTWRLDTKHLQPSEDISVLLTNLKYC